MVLLMDLFLKNSLTGCRMGVKAANSLFPPLFYGWTHFSIIRKRRLSFSFLKKAHIKHDKRFSSLKKGHNFY